VKIDNEKIPRVTSKTDEKPTSALSKVGRRKATKRNAISLFSGGGGLDIGFSAAGFNIVCSSDIDPYSCQTLLINSGKRPFYKHAFAFPADINQISASSLLESTSISDNEIDLVIGGPPCQAFSVFGRRKGLGDPRGNLVWEYLRIIEEVKPQAFVFENVAGLKSIHGGKLFREILEALSVRGLYTVTDHRYQVADFGVPQFRDRIFFIGTKNGIRVPQMEPTHGDGELFSTSKYRTVGEALRGLPAIDSNSNFPNHFGREHSSRIVNRYQSLLFGERDPKTRINKLHPERPSFTIIVGSDKGGGKGHVHPFEPREVTPRESARMQTFPDWWEFSGTGRHVIRQVGNAVPPLFAAILAEHVKHHVFQTRKKRGYAELIEILGLDYLKN
jgi:DNA (cytosine-5)-methyltransferase 1